MYNAAKLIPSRFLILISHFTICVTLLWSSTESVKFCLPRQVTEESLTKFHTEIVYGLGFAVGMMVFELIAFLLGLTMFHATSALLSIVCHSSSALLLCYFIFDSWQCGWFWWIFTLGSVLPLVHDICVIFDVLINRKY